jgi:hypothetical protein
MGNLAPLSTKEVEQLVKDWYKKLDVHAPMVEILPMLADGELEMQFPEATLHGHGEFEGWYQGVIRIFFDEVHTLKELSVKISEDEARADVKLVVYWEASRWNPPAAKSDRLMFDAYQTWIVKRSPETGEAVIVTYIVDELKPMEGSASL